MGDLLIGEASRQTGIKVPTIRYYEQIGLLAAPPRSRSNRRCYRYGDIRSLVFIRHAREMGFEIDDIRTLLALQARPETSCDQIDGLVARHLAAVDNKIHKLVELRRQLQDMLARCTGGPVAQCRVIESMAMLGK
jgi:DNA-binding transcriptional MerR regulator